MKYSFPIQDAINNRQMYADHLVSATSLRPEDDVADRFSTCTEAPVSPLTPLRLTQSAIVPSRYARCDMKCTLTKTILI
jgi:hypothetical protein